MDGFSYQNIFETKGIEYIAIILFFMILIPFWLVLSKRVKIGGALRKTLGVLSPRNIKVPQGIYFGSDHTWTHLSKKGVAAVGVDDLLLHITGDVKVTGVKNPGERIAKGEVMARLEQDGKYLEVCSPISGEILSSNSEVNENPSLLSEDPYNKGWLLKVKPENWVTETGSCYLAGEASWWIENELSRFRDFIAVTTARFSPDTSKVVLQDGGEIRENTLTDLPPEVWNEFQEYFLRNPGKTNR